MIADILNNARAVLVRVRDGTAGPREAGETIAALIRAADALEEANQKAAATIHALVDERNRLEAGTGDQGSGIGDQGSGIRDRGPERPG